MAKFHNIGCDTIIGRKCDCNKREQIRAMNRKLKRKEIIALRSDNAALRAERDALKQVLNSLLEEGEPIERYSGERHKIRKAAYALLENREGQKMS